MIEIKRVKTKAEQKQFVEFPLRLYRNNPYYVPPIYSEEMQIFDPNYVHYDYCEAIYYNAYVNGKICGRIGAIIQTMANEKWNRKRVRFTRFDCINNRKVARALFHAVEMWAKKKGMDAVMGPMGFTDQDREGLLIEGFDQMSAYEEQYNADYYQDLIEYCGYKKEVDWLESKIYLPDDKGEALQKMSDYVMKRYNLRFGEASSTKEFIEKYAEPFLDMIDERYGDLYGATPLTPKAREQLKKDFALFLNLKYCDVAVDPEGKVVALGLCFPSVGEVLQKSYGHLTPMTLLRLSKVMKHPKVIDLAFIAVDPEYVNKGVSVIVAARLAKILREDGVEYAESLLNMEDNTAILGMWKHFNAVQHKRRRAYLKNLNA